MYDFVAIGETTIDAFIRLEKKDSHYQLDKEHGLISLPYATKIPYEFVVEVPAVANASNASVSASRLGLTSALVASVGKDSNGEKCLETLKKEEVSTEFIKTHPTERKSILPCQSTPHELRHTNPRGERPAPKISTEFITMDTRPHVSSNLCQSGRHSLASPWTSKRG